MKTCFISLAFTTKNSIMCCSNEANCTVLATLPRRLGYLLTKTPLLALILMGLLTSPVAALETAILLPSDGTDGDFFGSSVSVSDNTAVVRAIRNDGNGDSSGLVYVFTRDSSGNWSEQAKLLPSDGTDGDFFGSSVSVSGNTVVMGAIRNDGNGDSSGLVYVFTRDSNGNWSEQAKLLPSDGTDGDFFGSLVSVSGNSAVVRASRNESNGDRSGLVYVFTRDSSGNWSEQARLIPSGGGFIATISISDNTVVMGASDDDTNGFRSGSAYVFSRDSSGNWSEQAKLLASDGTALDLFGNSVSVSGNTAVVGAINDNVNQNLAFFDPERPERPGEGSAYVFTRGSNGIWIEQAKLLASRSSGFYDFFGVSVSISGNTVVVGAVGDDRKGNNSGSAYVFTRDNSGNWNEQFKLLASNGMADDGFGNSVSVSSNTIVVGTVRGGVDNGSDDENSGSAYVFNKQVNIWSKAITPTTPSASDPNAVELGVKFTSAVDGFITGVLFFKGDGNNGTHIANLWTSDGQRLATSDFSAETRTGWQQINFESPVEITAGEIYIASYFAPLGHYAVDQSFFTDTRVINRPLQLLADDPNSGNGLYVYSSTSAFPNATYKANNYWVDVNFTANTTVAPYSCPCSLWDNTIIPNQSAANDSSAVELGVKFTSKIQGYISAIRFYKDDLNTGTHVGSLWSSDGQLLAQATFSNETASGWQQVDFDDPVPVAANTQYVASYHTEVGHYSVDFNYFSNSAYINGPLTSLSNSITGGNGLYLYGAGGFPTESWLASNYWVDVVFMTNIAP